MDSSGDRARGRRHTETSKRASGSARARSGWRARNGDRTLRATLRTSGFRQPSPSHARAHARLPQVRDGPGQRVVAGGVVQDHQRVVELGHRDVHDLRQGRRSGWASRGPGAEAAAPAAGPAAASGQGLVEAAGVQLELRQDGVVDHKGGVLGLDVRVARQELQGDLPEGGGGRRSRPYSPPMG